MSEPYDGQTAWREKLHMDEGAVQRLGRSVIRAGVSAAVRPALRARAEAGRRASSLVGAPRSCSPGFGLRALVKLRTWGVLAIGGAGALMVATSLAQTGDARRRVRAAPCARRCAAASRRRCRGPRRALRFLRLAR